MSRDYYLTAEVAHTIGLHPNTVRKYEEWGFLPPIPRAPNGYRMFSRMHVDQLRVVRMALRISWMGGETRRQAYSVIYSGAKHKFEEALDQASRLQQMILKEKRHALAAAAVLEQWATASRAVGESTARKQAEWSIGQAAKNLSVTVDMLRNWERNGLLSVPRDPKNGYRLYGPAEIDRLWVIRVLRKARYSMMAILRMINAFEAGRHQDLTAVLDTPRPDEDMVYVTDRWLTTLAEMEEVMEKMLNLLSHMVQCYGTSAAALEQSF